MSFLSFSDKKDKILSKKKMSKPVSIVLRTPCQVDFFLSLPLPQDKTHPHSFTYLSRRTTPSMQAPNRTTELMSKVENEGESLAR